MATNLSAVARARTTEALDRRDELARLFDLSRDVLLGTDSREALSTLARSVARRFDLTSVAIVLPRGEAWHIYDAGAPAGKPRSPAVLPGRQRPEQAWVHRHALSGLAAC